MAFSATWKAVYEKKGERKVEKLTPVPNKRRKNPEHEITDLYLTIDSDATLSRQQKQPIEKNLILKMAKGNYDHAKAVKLWGYLVTSGAKKYAKDFVNAADWNRIFTMADRKAVAVRFAKHFEEEAKLGNYDNFLPAKYKDWRVQKNPAPVFLKIGAKKIKAIAKRVAGKVKFFVTPQTLRAHPELMKRVKNPALSAAGEYRTTSKPEAVAYQKALPSTYSSTLTNKNGKWVVAYEYRGKAKNPKSVMKTFDVFWSPTGQKIATVQASTAKIAKSKAPAPYKKYKGEIYVVEK